MQNTHRALLVLALVTACSSPSPEAPSTVAEAPPSSAPAPSTAPPTSVAPAVADPSDDVVLAHHDEIGTCVQAAHASAPTLAGTVDVRWTVSSAGTVSDASVAASTLAASDAPDGGEPARALERCIVAAVGTWTSPAVEATHTASARHTFTIAGGEGVSIGTAAPALPRGTTRASDPTVSSGLTVDIVRRVVRRHLNEVRFCYEQGLATTPTLTGRVDVHFTIDTAGETVTPVATPALTATDADTSAVATQVSTCISTAVDRWTFPIPEGGATVTVDYPFALEPAPPSAALPSPAPPIGGGGHLGTGAGYGYGS